MKRILLFLLLLLIVGQVHAVAIGVNKASIQFNEVLRDGFAREVVTVTTDSVLPVKGEVLLRNPGEAAAWLNFSATNFTFSRDKPYKLIIDIQPPRDARIETYRVNMSILTGELAPLSDTPIGSATRASLGVPIFLKMTGTERRECRVAGVKVLDTERDQQVEIQMSVLNTGNVRVNPRVDVEIYDKFRSTMLAKESHAFGKVVLPTLTDASSVFYDFSLDRNQYWALVQVPECGYSSVFTFDVLEAGEIKDDGDFIRINAPSWSKVGDIISIEAVFRNRGVRSLRANFRGTITHLDSQQIVKVINTDQYIVDPDVTAEIETFFNPLEPGRYMIAGKVFYNEKLTIERSAVLNVSGSALTFGNPLVKSIALILLALIITFLILIIRKKKRRRHFRY